MKVLVGGAVSGAALMGAGLSSVQQSSAFWYNNLQCLGTDDFHIVYPCLVHTILRGLYDTRKQIDSLGSRV